MILEKELDAIDSQKRAKAALNKSLLGVLFLSLAMALNVPAYPVAIQYQYLIMISAIATLVFIILAIFFIVASFRTILTHWKRIRGAKVYVALVIDILVLGFMFVSVILAFINFELPAQD